ncbi:MAG: Uma2 family endonuclease [Acidobacteria bacterium]|nr:Uma2 family endonuclease [Acidobacteriota bacterium]
MPVVLDPLELVGEDTKPRLTREECAALGRAGSIDLERFELLEGSLIPKMSKGHWHSMTVEELVRWLRRVHGYDCVRQEIAIDPVPCDFSTSDPEPDAIVTTSDYDRRSGPPRPRQIRFVGEVAYSSQRIDLGLKAGLYARSEIPEYWVLDITGRRIVIHRDPVDDHYRSIVEYGEDERVEMLSAPGQEVRAGDLLIFG